MGIHIPVVVLFGTSFYIIVDFTSRSVTFGWVLLFTFCVCWGGLLILLGFSRNIPNLMFFSVSRHRKIYEFVLRNILIQNKHTKVKDSLLLTNEGEKLGKD